MVPILFLVGALGAGGDNLLVPLITSLGGAAIAVLAILASGKFIIRPLFRAVASARSSELFVAGALLIVIATATPLRRPVYRRRWVRFWQVFFLPSRSFATNLK